MGIVFMGIQCSWALCGGIVFVGIVFVGIVQWHLLTCRCQDNAAADHRPRRDHDHNECGAHEASSATSCEPEAEANMPRRIQ